MTPTAAKCYREATPHLGLDEPTPSATASALAGWAVFTTHSNAEHWAARNLQHLGYRIFLPTTLVRRRDPVLKTLSRDVVISLFGPYGFVWLTRTDPWMPVCLTPGVRSFLMSGSRPGYAPTAAVEALQAGEALRRSQMPASPFWQPGQACTPAGGPLRRLPAVIAAIHGDTAIITLLMLGSLRDVEIPVSHLAARSDA